MHWCSDKWPTSYVNLLKNFPFQIYLLMESIGLPYFANYICNQNVNSETGDIICNVKNQIFGIGGINSIIENGLTI